MLGPRVTETRGTAADLSQDYKGFLISDPWPPSYIKVMQRKKTVKELLRMKYQKRSFSQVDNSTEHTFKSAKLETCASGAGPWTPGPQAPVTLTPAIRPPPDSPQSGGVTPQQMQLPALWGQVAPAAGVRTSLFHWQIQREEQRVGGITPEMLNMQDEDGDTFLHIAVAQGRRALAYVLADKMAECGSLDTKEHNGQTALQLAAATNQHLIVQDLLAHGAQINTWDCWGRSPLHVCAEKGHFLSLQKIWRTVSRQPLDIEMFNYEGLTPLHAAVLSHNAVIRELRCQQNTCSYVAMELAQRRQMFVECIKTLLFMGASHGAIDLGSGRTCLHMASEEANVELLQLFLDQPSSPSIVNVKMFSGNTALHIVSSSKNHKTQVEAVRLLMNKGADHKIKNLENELPSQLVPEGPIGEKVKQMLKGKFVQA